MIRVVVRSKKDRDAVAAALRTFYTGWDIELTTLGGLRDPGEAFERIRSLESDGLTIVLLGRENEDFLAYEREAPPNVVYHLLKYKKVRNARTIAIARAIEHAKAKFRLDASWERGRGTYLFDHRLERLVDETEPAYDFFIIFGQGIDFLNSLGLHVRQPLLLRKMGGVHAVYDCGVYSAALIFRDSGRPEVSVSAAWEPKEVCGEKSLNDIAAANAKRIRLLERFSTVFLEKISENRGVKRVVVPLSGGKDSAVALYLARKLWGDAVEAVYVDTGVDFPENAESIEMLAEKIGVSVERVRAPVRESIGRFGLPTHENRWCTGLKIEALRRFLKKIGAGKDTLVIVGDRDVESRSRARRPPLRYEEERLVAAPLKLWGSHHIELFLALHGLPVNPLYELGFYRTGCYICPSLRSWELYVMEKAGILDRLKERDNEIVELFLKEKNWI